jgi:hypothetical protein
MTESVQIFPSSKFFQACVEMTHIIWVLTSMGNSTVALSPSPFLLTTVSELFSNELSNFYSEKNRAKTFSAACDQLKLTRRYLNKPVWKFVITELRPWRTKYLKITSTHIDLIKMNCQLHLVHLTAARTLSLTTVISKEIVMRALFLVCTSIVLSTHFQLLIET